MKQKQKETHWDTTVTVVIIMKTACISVVALICLFLVAYAEILRTGAEIRDGNRTMKRPCYRYDVDGCSVPLGLPFFYKGQFTRSCDRHDICYHCGVEYGFTKDDCDNAFRDNTLETCENQYLSDSSATASQRELIRASVKDLGSEGVTYLLSQETTKDVGQYHQPGLPEFFEWFSDHDTIVRVGAAWVVQVAEHAQALEQEQEQDIATKEQQYPTNEDGQLSRKRRAVKENDGIISSNTQNRNVLSFQVKRRGYTRNNLIRDVQEYIEQQDLAPTVAGSELGSDIISYLICDFFSEVYYWAVAVFGGSSFHDVPEFYCNQSFVQKCLPQD